jgi:Domain of unknown function (DUF4337)
MSLHEHMEHAAHADHHAHHAHPADDHAKSFGRHIGITMAILGVLLALCSAMLGGARNKLISTMIEHTAVGTQYQAVSTKHRTLMAQLQQLHALLPENSGSFDQAEKQIESIEQASSGQPALPMIKVARLETAKILNTVTPTASDVLRFVKIVREYDAERKHAEHWNESFADAIVAHEHASEHYEWALLCAEFGIVISSIALLLLNRKAWYAAVALGAVALILVVWTTVSYHGVLGKAEAKIEEAKKEFQANSLSAKRAKDDADLLEDIERIESKTKPH